MKKILINSLVVSSLFFLATSLWARPEYAAQYSISRCTACHISPAGGGARNIYGKQFGARNYELTPFSQQEYFYGDLRSIYYKPFKEEEKSKGGAGLMATALSLNAPIYKNKKNGREISAVIEYDLGGFSFFRKTYVGIKNFDEDVHSILPQYILIGRFQPPFGVLTDEHRTYTKILSNDEWSTAFDGGVYFAGDPAKWLHYDALMITNGAEKDGGKFDSGGSTLLGYIFNFRLTPQNTWFPGVLGASFSEYDTADGTQKPVSKSFYGILSLDRFTNNILRGSIIYEHVRAKRFLGFIKNFFADDAFRDQAAEKDALANLIYFSWNLSNDWTIIIKRDFLQPDPDFPGDWFERVGFGFNYTLGPNILLKARYENATATPLSEENSTAIAAQDAFWMLLQLSI